MTTGRWDPDGAEVMADDVDDEGVVWRYGVTGWEATHPEPLDVALAQEIPDPSPDADGDEQWELVDDEDEQLAGRLVADDAVQDDDYALAVDDPEELAPEERAIHVVSSP